MSTFTVNGQSVTVEENRKLIRFLRDELRLTSVKDGCSEGACGTCTVLIDGKATRACIPQTDKLEGKTIVTVEGLTDWEKEVYTYAFGQAGAVQCGFCTPGMVMAAKGLLDVNPSPSREEAAFAIRTNICRCTGYVKIIDAILLAAEVFRAGKLPEGPGDWSVGSRVPRIDAEEKVRGTGIYPDDIYLDGMIYASAIRSAYPRARVLAIHPEEALALPGVVGVFTAADIPGNIKVGHLVKDWDAMIPVGSITHYLGDAICIVAAETPEILAQAKSLVKIDYEELPGIYTMADGYRKNSFIVHTGRKSGDVEQAKQRPDIVKINVSKEIEPQEHACMEPVSAIGMVQDGKTTVYACTQAPFEIRSMLAKILDKPEEDIRVIVTPLGGGFGKKCDAFLEAPAAVAAQACGQPVKITLTRREDLLLTTKRHGYHTDYEIGFTPDGRFQYLDCRMFSDGGPYECESYGTLMTGALMSGGPYIIPNVRVEGSAIRNNNLQGGAFRGYGINQAAISIETAMDMMAEKLGIDPFELRRRNAVYPGATSVGGEVLKYSMGMMDTINQCEKSLKKALKEYEGQYPKGSKVLGWGMASGFKNVGVGKGIFTDDGACKLILQGDGRLHMIVSGTDMGQGFRTAMTQVAAETLDMDICDIYITNGDTELTIPTGESVSERQTLCGGRAVYEACVKLRQDLDSRPWQPGEERRAEYYYACDPCFAIGDFEGAKKRGAKYRNFPAYAYATQAAIVEVDRETGEVRLLKVIAAHDVGRAINPHIIEGQMHGSCSMGQGYALTEGYPTENGYPVKTLYRQLGLPRAEDTPDYEIILIEDPEPQGPFGAKGISEVATVPVTPAILNAVSRAIGVRINKVPASPEVVLEAIRTGKCGVLTMEQQIKEL